MPKISFSRSCRGCVGNLRKFIKICDVTYKPEEGLPPPSEFLALRKVKPLLKSAVPVDGAVVKIAVIATESVLTVESYGNASELSARPI